MPKEIRHSFNLQDLRGALACTCRQDLAGAEVDLVRSAAAYYCGQRLPQQATNKGAGCMRNRPRDVEIQLIITAEHFLTRFLL